MLRADVSPTAPFLLISASVSCSTLLLARTHRDAEVLSLFATIINKLQGAMEKEVPRIFEAVFEVTLTMITKNFEVRIPWTNNVPQDGTWPPAH